MKKILFPTDFSEAANKAFIYALNVAAKMEAQIVTLHVFRQPEIGAHYMPNMMQDFFETFAWHEFESYKSALPPLRKMADDNGFSKVEMIHVMEEGENIVDSILQMAAKEAVEMIVMSTAGAEGLKAIFLGSVAGEVMENANVPVLAVPEEAVFDGQINKVAFTTTYREEEKRTLRRLMGLQQLFDFEIHCINVDTAHVEFYRKDMDKLKEEFADLNNGQFVVLDGNDVFKVLTTYLEENKIDILAMTTRKRNFLQELFEYSRTKFLSYHSDTPILSFQVHTLS
ncbi:MAG: universal stress protein [Bacteroidota bacterium]